MLAAESEEGGADEEADMQAMSAIAQALIATKNTLQGNLLLQLCARHVKQLTISHCEFLRMCQLRQFLSEYKQQYPPSEQLISIKQTSLHLIELPQLCPFPTDHQVLPGTAFEPSSGSSF